MIEQVKQIVREASEIIKRAGDIAENTMAKEGTANYVTKYDLEVQKFLMKRLSETFEGCHFIGEEAGCDENPVARGLTFIIDPIDGTTNYFRRRRCSMISIGAVENRRPVFGALYDPYLNELFTAERGKGAYCNGEALHVTDVPLVQSLLEDVTALTITKCVDFDPSAEAASICGFDAPAATLNVTYATEGGAQQQLHITVGSRLPDGSGRYIRQGDDTTLFFLPTELLDPLMRIAAEGLGD